MAGAKVIFKSNSNLTSLAALISATSALFLAGCGSGGSTPTDTTSGTTGTTGSTPSGARPAVTGDGVTASGDTIKIGLVASMTGDNKPWGEDSYEGAKIAVDEYNAAGGFNGKQIEMLMEDSASKPDQAKLATEKLLSDGAIALVGEVSSGNTIQMAKAAFPKAVAVVAIGATKTTLTDEGNHVFRVCYNDDFQGAVMAKFAYDKLGLRNVAVMTDTNLPYSQGLSANFISTFTKLGGKIAHEAKYSSTDPPQYSGQLTELKAKASDGLFLSGYFTEVGPIAQQARAAGITVPLLGGDGWDSPTILTSGGDAILGGYFCNHYNNQDKRPEVDAFLSKWKAKHGGKLPNTTMAALGYDAMKLTLDALTRAGEANSKKIIEALEATEGFKGVSGDVTLKGKNGTPDKRAIVVEIIKAGPADFQKFAIAYNAEDVK